jgi:SAM-dependent methyltransferase
MLARAPEPKRVAKPAVLPFADASFGAVALLYALYHLLPAAAVAEAHRVVRPGGLVAVAAPSRDDSPELAEALPRTPRSLDSERAPELLGELFTEVEVERWDAQPLELATRAAVRDYLTGKGVEAHVAQGRAEAVAVPLSVAKRGVLAFGRKT